MIDFTLKLYLFIPPHVICTLLFSNTLGGSVCFFPSQNTHHRNGYQISCSASILVMSFHCMGDSWRSYIFCAVDDCTFCIRLHCWICPLRRFRPAIASPSLSSVSHFGALTIALIFPLYTLLPPSSRQFVEWSHRWPTQSLLVTLLNFLHLHIPPALLPDSNDSYGQRTTCWSVPLTSTTFYLVQVGHANLTRPTPSLRFIWTCIGLGATVQLYRTQYLLNPIALLISWRGWSMPWCVLLCTTVHHIPS